MSESWHEYHEREAEEARLAERQERSERFLPKRGGDVMRDLETNQVIGQAAEKLMDQLTMKEEELRRREQSIGKSHDIRKINRLRDEIASLQRRLDIALNALERQS